MRALSFQPTRSSPRPSFHGVPLRACPAVVSRPIRTVPLEITAKYRGLNTDLSKVEEFRKHEKDTGSVGVQVARFSARVDQLTAHLKRNKHDYSTLRGLQLMLGKRRRMLFYLYKHDRPAFDKCIKDLKIRFNISKAMNRL